MNALLFKVFVVKVQIVKIVVIFCFSLNNFKMLLNHVFLVPICFLFDVG